MKKNGSKKHFLNFPIKIFKKKHPKNYLRVLTYHRISEINDTPFMDHRLISATPKEFEWQIKYLKKYYNVVSIEQVLDAICEKEKLPRKAVLITFDDAYKDFKENAWPVLKKFGMSTVVFVPTGFPDQPQKHFWWDRLYSAIMHTTSKEYSLFPKRSFNFGSLDERIKSLREIEKLIKTKPHAEALKLVEKICSELGAQNGADKDNVVLSWKDLKKLSEEGVAIGAHTRTHPILTNISLNQVREEVIGAKEDLYRGIGTIPLYFSYPNCNFNEPIMQILREENFKIAFTGIDGHNNLNAVDPLALHRTNITRKTSPFIFKVRLNRFFTVIDRWRHR